MFKHSSLLRKLVWLSMPIIGVGLLGGCMTNPNFQPRVSGEQYVYHASNGRVFYQDSDGRYYFEGKNGRFYFKKYYVKKHGHHYYRYYRYYPDTNAQYIKNSNVSINVRERLLNDPALQGQMITVRNHKGWVELLGNVQSTYQKERAASLALSVPGVNYVDDDLVVKGY
jgi:hypothetical protein